VIVLDSVGGARGNESPSSGRDRDAVVGAQARLMSAGCASSGVHFEGEHRSLIFTNQIREKIGVMFGQSRDDAGGKALNSTRA